MSFSSPSSSPFHLCISSFLFLFLHSLPLVYSLSLFPTEDSNSNIFKRIWNEENIIVMDISFLFFSCLTSLSIPLLYFSPSPCSLCFVKLREGNSAWHPSEWSSGLRRVTRNHILETGRRFKSCFRRFFFSFSLFLSLKILVFFPFPFSWCTLPPSPSSQHLPLVSEPTTIQTPKQPVNTSKSFNHFYY